MSLKKHYWRFIKKISNKNIFFDSQKLYRRCITKITINNKELSKLAAKKKVFFVLSTGRTGTKWLSSTLNEYSSSASVKHEPLPEEQRAQVKASQSYTSARNYVNDFRLKDIFFRLKSLEDLEVYGEVNSALRRHLLPLREAIPSAKFIHLVRNGKDVVRSVFSRDAYHEKHSLYREYLPPRVPFTRSEWMQLSEFERTCWAWRGENEFLRDHISLRSRFEDILSSYELFQEQILEPLHLNVSQSDWRGSTQKSENSTSRYKIPSWEDWSTDMKRTFENICGDEMAQYDYQCGG